MDSTLTMDRIITGLGQIKATIIKDEAHQDDAEVLQAAVNVLFALSEEGVQTAEDAMDILHDYRVQARQCKALHNKHQVAGQPFLKDSVWHCPDCNRKVAPNHSFCHRCGKKLGWR